jgi:hypothetical protein
MPAQLLQKERVNKAKAIFSAATDRVEVQPKIFILSAPLPAVLDGPVSPPPKRLCIRVGDMILTDKYIEFRSVKVAPLFSESSFWYKEPEVSLEGSSTDEISSTKVFGGGPKPGDAGAPPVKVNSVCRVFSVLNSERVKIKPFTCSPVEVDNIDPSKSLSVFPTPIYFRRRQAPFTPRISIYELPTTRRCNA